MQRTRTRRLRVPVDVLAIGMFVAELDRPWLDTPFALQGVLLQRQAQIDAMHRFCRYVYVDLDRSAADACQALRAIAEANERRMRRQEEPTGLVPGLVSRLRALFGGREATPEPEPDPTLATTAARLRLPPGIRLQRHAEPVPLEQAMPKARRAVADSAELLDNVLRALRENHSPDFTRIDDAAGSLVESVIESADALMLVARLREGDRDTYEHGLKAALNLLALGRHLGFPREELIHLAKIGMLADAGKTLVPRDLLLKPGLLTPAEHDVIKTHVGLGMAALRKGMQLHPAVAQGIEQHHERMDGSGYPKGLTGEAISIYGRMAAIADCFSALITDRPYAQAMAPQDALLRLYEWSARLLHEPLVEQLVQAIGVFPVGSLVELSNGEVGLVVTHNRVRRLEPKVLVLAGADKQPLAAPFERDLMANGQDADGRTLRIARGVADGEYGLGLHDYYSANREPDEAIA